MDEKLIHSLWDRFDKSDAVELVYESGDSKLKLRKAEPIKKQVYNGCITSAGLQGMTIPQSLVQEGLAQTGNTAVGSNTGNATGSVSSISASYGNNAAAGDPHTGAADMTNASANMLTTDDLSYVRSPLPGTFYRSASPDDEPYVIIGSKVKQGDVIGLVESMKMMNEIVAPADGTVAEILAENGSIVGYDDKLIRLS